jgi:2',3'-cyclic-nucleotide 2'-phosphodiesterase (5'-nucleotidase family)
MACCGRRRSRSLQAAIRSSIGTVIDVSANGVDWRQRAELSQVRLGCQYPRHAASQVGSRSMIDGFRIYVLHILADLNPQAAGNVDAVIYGHSHQPKIETKNGTLFLNPGSAGPRRFRLPITIGRVTMAE